MSSSSCSSTRSSAENSSDDDDAASGSAITLDEDIDTALSGGLKDEAAASLANAPGHAWAPAYATTQQDASDFLWMLTEEPHRTRRMAILKAHPEVRTLMGHEPLTRYLSAAVVVLQLAIAVGLAQAGVHPLDWRFLLTAYVVGGTANQNIFLAIHEITHNLAFRGIAANKLWAIFVNAPIGVPYAMMFKKYHIEHHKHLGEEGVDTDLPTRIELACLQNVLGKAFFATFQIFFYALRPGFVRTQRLTPYHLANAAFQVALDVLMVKYVGWTALLYLLESSFFAGSLHPCAAHFIAEHYMFGGIQQETWSYYGPLNALAYNVSMVLRPAGWAVWARGLSFEVMGADWRHLLLHTSRRSATTTSTTTSRRCPGRVSPRSAAWRPSSTTCSRTTRHGRSSRCSSS